MRSRGEGWRRTAERVLRGVALAAAAWLAVRAWTERAASDAMHTARSAALDSALAVWTASAPSRVHLGADRLPSRAQRDWLVALRRAGARVSWQPATAPSASGMVVESVPSPAGQSRLALVASPGEVARIGDALGEVAASTIAAGAALSLEGRLSGAVRAELPAATLVSAARDSAVLRHVLVLGSAGWESKFVAAALEEDGWPVRIGVVLAPGASVGEGSAGQGGAPGLDTARLSAVVVLDSASVPNATALRRYVENGGGVVLAGSAARAGGIAPLLPARAPRRDPGVLAAPAGDRARASLPAWVFGELAPDGVALERRGARAVVAVRRAGAGRVLVSGYEDTWRWRMTGQDEDAPGAHRAWWSRLVASVVYASVGERSVPPLDEAPLAAATAHLGSPLPPAEGPRTPWRPSDAVLFAILVLALLGEWFSRRLRGVR